MPQLREVIHLTVERHGISKPIGAARDCLAGIRRAHRFRALVHIDTPIDPNATSTRFPIPRDEKRQLEPFGGNRVGSCLGPAERRSHAACKLVGYQRNRWRTRKDSNLQPPDS